MPSSITRGRESASLSVAAIALVSLLCMHASPATAAQYGGRKSMSLRSAVARGSVRDQLSGALARSICAQYGQRSDSVFSVLTCGFEEPVKPAKGLEGAERKPVVLVPGFGGSGIDATITNDTSPSRMWFCPRKSETFHIWFSVFELLTQVCQFEELTLPYDATTKAFGFVHPGIDISPTDFGGVSGIDFLERVGGKPIGLTSYMDRMVQSLEGAGYTAGVDVRGAPYDFRLPPDEPKYLAKLQALIEDTYTKNGGKKVVLVAHSFGCLNTLELLYLMDAQWKATYVDTFVPIAGPWIGTSKTLRAILLGTDFGVNVLGMSILRPKFTQSAAKTFPGLLWMLPAAGERWEETVVANVGDQHYTATNVTDLIRQVGLTETADAYEVIKERRDAQPVLPAPGVPVTCMYAKGVPTEGVYGFESIDKIKPGKDPESIGTVDGDGTVPARSLGYVDRKPIRAIAEPVASSASVRACSRAFACLAPSLFSRPPPPNARSVRHPKLTRVLANVRLRAMVCTGYATSGSTPWTTTTAITARVAATTPRASPSTL